MSILCSDLMYFLIVCIDPLDFKKVFEYTHIFLHNV